MTKELIIKKILLSMFYIYKKTFLKNLFKNNKNFGTVFVLHNIVADGCFESKIHGSTTDVFLEKAILRIKELNIDIVSLDEMRARLIEKRKKPFVVFTFDDGYTNNFTIAYPIFKKHEVPMNLYIATDFINHKPKLWTFLLQKLIETRSEIEFSIKEKKYAFSLNTYDLKVIAYNNIKNLFVRARVGKKSTQELFLEIFGDEVNEFIYGASADLFLDWKDLFLLSQDPLVTIGSHSKSHRQLNRLEKNELYHELFDSKSEIESNINKKVEHFAYPFGTKKEAGPSEYKAVSDCGYLSGVTTIPGHIKFNNRLNFFNIKRIPLNAAFEDIDNVEILLSGFPFVL